MMKPHHFAYLPLMVGATFSASAFAQAENTLTFTGSLEQPTCIAQVAGTAAGNTTIDLGPIKTTDLPSPTSSGPMVPFTIMLKGCPAGYKPFAYFYAPADAIGPDKTYLKNTHTPAEEAAQGLGVAIYFENKIHKYPINSTPATQPKRNPYEPSNNKADKDGNATLTYHVRFMRHDTLKPGAFRSQVKYTIHYE